MSDYKDTLNLPETAFPMRGNLAKREPEMLKRWYDEDLYGAIRQAKKGKKNIYFARRSSVRERQHSYWSLC